MDFDARFAPLVRQTVLLRQGVADPAWQSAWPVLTLLLLLAAAAIFFSGVRQAGSTRPTGGMRTSRNA